MVPFVQVIGLGHVGLPMACWVAHSGYRVHGYDINPETVRAIREAKVTIDEYHKGRHISQVAQRLISKGRLMVSDSLGRGGAQAGIFVLAVGLAEGPRPGMNGPLVSAVRALLPILCDEDLVLLRTTLVPGTCDAVIRPLLQSTGKNIHMAYCPETIAETRAFEELKRNPVILASNEETAFQMARRFMRSLTRAAIHRAPDFRSAELAKVVQNVSRDVEIALANEISDVARQLGVPPSELLRLVNTHPRVKLLRPGPGVGGYCLPNALEYMTAALNGPNAPPMELSKAARTLNARRPEKVVELIRKALGEAGKTIRGARIAILGLGMKDGCADIRRSPALEIAGILMAEGACVRAFDPVVPISFPFQSTTWQECVKGTDVVLIAARQRGLELNPMDMAAMMAIPPVFVDTRDGIPDCDGISIYRL